MSKAASQRDSQGGRGGFNPVNTDHGAHSGGTSSQTAVPIPTPCSFLTSFGIFMNFEMTEVYRMQYDLD